MACANEMSTTKTSWLAVGRLPKFCYKKGICTGGTKRVPVLRETAIELVGGCWPLLAQPGVRLLALQKPNEVRTLR